MGQEMLTASRPKGLQVAGRNLRVVVTLRWGHSVAFRKVQEGRDSECQSERWEWKSTSSDTKARHQDQGVTHGSGDTLSTTYTDTTATTKQITPSSRYTIIRPHSLSVWAESWETDPMGERGRDESIGLCSWAANTGLHLDPSGIEAGPRGLQVSSW